MSLSSRSSAPDPFSVNPTQYWDGNDGQWSSFAIEIGSPPQQVRVYFSSLESTIWTVLAEGCPDIETSGSNCARSRGGLFNETFSTTFRRIGTYFSLLYEGAAALGYDGNAEVGNDTVVLGWPGSTAPAVVNQIVEGFAAPFPYLGLIGLHPATVNLSTLSQGYPSLLTNMRLRNEIPSLSWSYTAGAMYQVPPAFGSLTIGGHDTSRHIANNISMPMSPNAVTNLVLAIQTISTNISESTLLPNGVYALIDTMVSTIWLPLAACAVFESVFDLTWDNQTGFYLLNDSTHMKLLALNPEVIFTVAANLSTNTTLDIRLPYASFDLQVTPPLVANSSRYFPLQRALNASQIILGRTFFQEAYLTADYERSQLTISQATTGQGLVRNLVTIPAVYSSPSSDGNTLGSGAIAGIAIGGFALLATLFIVVCVLRRRSRITKAAPQPTYLLEEKKLRPLCDSIPDHPPTELDARSGPSELPDGDQRISSHELPSPPLPSSPFVRYEAPSSPLPSPPPSMSHKSPPMTEYELASPPVAYELPAYLTGFHDYRPHSAQVPGLERSDMSFTHRQVH